MGLHQNLARIRPADVEALSKASDHLAAVAATIKVSKANYVDSCVALLIEANQVILGLRDRGLARITKYLERQQDQLDAEARARPREDAGIEDAAAAPRGWPGSEPHE